MFFFWFAFLILHQHRRTEVDPIVDFFVTESRLFLSVISSHEHIFYELPVASVRRSSFFLPRLTKLHPATVGNKKDNSPSTSAIINPSRDRPDISINTSAPT
ncbi:unnamed protein product [Tenebrio molitor]|jgi:hypothetical protein|nr:unnamed protein product [Tenebrio molitor]